MNAASFIISSAAMPAAAALSVAAVAATCPAGASGTPESKPMIGIPAACASASWEVTESVASAAKADCRRILGESAVEHVNLRLDIAFTRRSLEVDCNPKVRRSRFRALLNDLPELMLEPFCHELYRHISACRFGFDAAGEASADSLGAVDASVEADADGVVPPPAHAVTTNTHARTTPKLQLVFSSFLFLLKE